MRFKNFIIVVLLWCCMTVPSVSAQTSSGSATASSAATTVTKEILNLKEKIATKVAELRKQNSRATAGLITELTSSVLKIKTVQDDEYTVKLDSSLTKVFVVAGSTKKEMKIADIKKGAYIIVTGPVADKVISANFIYQDELFLVKSGKVTSVNTDDNSIKVLTSDKDTYTLTVDTPTRLQIMDSKTFEIDAARFSKMKEGDTVHFIVKKTGQEKEVNHFTPDKVLIIPQEYFIK